jgi:hypothetical protein
MHQQQQQQQQQQQHQQQRNEKKFCLSKKNFREQNFIKGF